MNAAMDPAIDQEKIIGGTGITADGNVTFGDVSGTVATGNNIQIIVNKDGSKTWLYTQGIKPATDPANIFGRLRELNKIDEFFKHNSVLAITGVRGTGKSTLASMYLDIIEKRGDFAGIYWRRMDETIDIRDVVGSFFTAISKPVQELGQYKIPDLLNLFFRELNTAPYFLVFDNFEILLNPNINKPIKPGFSDLIDKVKESSKSRFLFTSWECPVSEGGIRPEYYCIGGLDEQAAIKLLRRLGLTESDRDIKKVIELSGGHPKALILLAQLVKEGENLSNILEDSTLWKGEIAENILDKVYNERLSEEERKLLQYVSLYREPVPLIAIVSVANDPAMTEAVIRKMALKLKRKSLLQKTETGDNYWEDSLIHDYAYNKLDDRVKRHKLAHQYYLSLQLPEKPTRKEDVASLIEAHFHACKAEEYDLAASIIFDKNLDQDLDMWEDFRTLVELYIGVLPNDHFKDKPLLSEPKTHILVLESLGLAYTDLGQVEKAIQYYEKALAIAQEMGERKREGTNVGSLGLAYWYLDQAEKAIQYYEKALAIAQEIGDRRNEGVWLGNLGIAYSSLGQFEKAIEYYRKALDIDQEIGSRRGEGTNLGNLGIAYSSLGRFEKAIEYYQKALDIDQEIGNRRGEGTNLGNLGNAYDDLGQVEKAIQYYEKSLDIDQEIGNRRGEEIDFNNLGFVLEKEKRYREALACYLMSKKIYREIKAPNLKTILESNINNLKEELGENEFEKLIKEVEPGAEEIIRKMLE
jgi:tetratricopeptide (TPR) repeat protein